jgi:hypothetical protein
MKNPNDPIGNRSLDRPACSAVPEPTVPPPTPYVVLRFDIYYINRLPTNLLSKCSSSFFMTKHAADSRLIWPPFFPIVGHAQKKRPSFMPLQLRCVEIHSTSVHNSRSAVCKQTHAYMERPDWTWRTFLSSAWMPPHQKKAIYTYINICA